MKPIISSRLGRLTVAVATMWLPWILRRPILTLLLGYRLDPSSRIGLSIVAAASVEIGKGGRIGHLTVCRGIKSLQLDDYARIGNLNWITGNGDAPLPRSGSENLAQPGLKVGKHSAITHRHYIDCSDSISIGVFSTIAGVRSQFLTHSIDIQRNRQQACPITIGNYCFVGTGCIVLGGSALPDCSVLAAGTLLREKLDQSWMLYAGIPAQAKKEIPKDYGYFSRAEGFVD